MRILIAGASGAIGRALVRRLRANQHEVFALTQSRDSGVDSITGELPEATSKYGRKYGWQHPVLRMDFVA